MKCKRCNQDFASPGFVSDICGNCADELMAEQEAQEFDSIPDIVFQPPFYKQIAQAQLSKVLKPGYKSPEDGITRIFFAGRELKEDEYKDYMIDWAKTNGYSSPAEVEAKIEEAKKQERERIRLWGSERCLEHHTSMNNILHRDCNECWQSLKSNKGDGE